MNEGDRIGHVPAERAVVEFLRRENAQGATVIRGIEGFGATGEIHVSHLADLVQKLPLIVEWIDLPERVEGALQEMVSAAPGGFGERALPPELEKLAARIREMEGGDGAAASPGLAAASEA